MGLGSPWDGIGNHRECESPGMGIGSPWDGNENPREWEWEPQGMGMGARWDGMKTPRAGSLPRSSPRCPAVRAQSSGSFFLRSMGVSQLEKAHGGSGGVCMVGLELHPLELGSQPCSQLSRGLFGVQGYVPAGSAQFPLSLSRAWVLLFRFVCLFVLLPFTLFLLWRKPIFSPRGLTATLHTEPRREA